MSSFVRRRIPLVKRMMAETLKMPNGHTEVLRCICYVDRQYYAGPLHKHGNSDMAVWTAEFEMVIDLLPQVGGGLQLSQNLQSSKHLSASANRSSRAATQM
jgi:hypothetical protein